MVDIIWANYKGILYPLDLEATEQSSTSGVASSLNSPSSLAETNPFLPEATQLKPLVDLCAEKTVMDATSTSRALEVVPTELYYSLMRAALTRSRDRSIEVLISKWPWTGLSLRRLAPSLFDSLATLYSNVHVAERMRRGVKYTTCLAHTFVECLKKRTPTKLKYLDLTGYPAAEVIVNYLSSHVLLVYNEARQKEIISLYNKVTHDWPQEQRQNYNLDTTLPDDTFLICVDAFVQTIDTHMELCRALKTSRSDACRFRLRVQKLDLTCLGVARISILLEQVDPQHLTALCLQFNGLSNEGMAILGPSLQRLKQLTALDLSCNNISLSHDPTCELLAETLAALPELTRLDLSNNRVKHRLRPILSRLQRPLVYLKVCACGLSDLDLIYLSQSRHRVTLRELDISENCLGRYVAALRTLLRTVASTLVVLELEDCAVSAENWPGLLMLSPPLQRLRFLNVSGNGQLTAELLLSLAPHLSGLERLEAVQASYPLECYVSEHDIDRNDSAMERFEQKLTALMVALGRRLQRHPVKVTLKT